MSHIPSFLSQDYNSTPRIVQKQVLRVRGHAKGCTALLYLRLAIPTPRRTRTFALFPDEGVKLKASIVYPVELEKGGRTVLPSDASDGLKRASNILSGQSEKNQQPCNPEARGQEQGKEPFTQDKSKKSKPRITCSNFHVSLVCPPGSDTIPNDDVESVGKSHFVAVIQMELELALSPPKWPFETHIPLPRCLNNKVHFSTDDVDSASSNVTVEFDPPLIKRPSSPTDHTQTEPSAFSGDLDTDVESQEDAMVSGTFAACDVFKVRWAAVADEALNQTKAREIYNEIFVESVRESDVDNEVELATKMRISLRGAYVSKLAPTTEIKFSLWGLHQARWVAESISVSCKNDRCLLGWSLNGHKTSLSRSSSLSDFLPNEVTPSLSTRSVSLDLFQEDDAFQLSEVSPPKEVIEASFESVADDSTLLVPSLVSPKKGRRSAESVQSASSIYSQMSAQSDDQMKDSNELILTLRVSSLRTLASLGQDIVFEISSLICVPLQESVQEGSRIIMPAIISKDIESRCHIDFSKIPHDQLETVEGVKTEKQNVICHIDEGKPEGVRGVATLIVFPSIEEECIGDISANTVHTLRQPILAGEISKAQSEDSVDAFSFPRNGHDDTESEIAHWSGIIESVQANVWVKEYDSLSIHPTVQVIQHICMTWPLSTLPESRAANNKLPAMAFAFSTDEQSNGVHVLHASIQGHTVDVEQNPSPSHDTHTSSIIELRLPDQLQHGTPNKIIASLMVATECLKSAPLPVFASVASTVVHFHAEVKDERLQDMLPSIDCTNEALCVSSKVDQAQKSMCIDVAMLPAMSSVTSRYIPRNQPLMPVLPSTNAPRRRSTNTQEQREQVEVDRDVRDKRPSHQHPVLEDRSPWKLNPNLAVVLVLLAIVAVASTILASLKQIRSSFDQLSAKVELISFALNVQYREGEWTPSPSQASVGQKIPDYSEEHVDWAQMYREITAQRQSASPSTAVSFPLMGLRDLLAVLSNHITAILTWPLRVAMRTFA